MNSVQILIIALVIDYFIGDPEEIWRRFPHPAVVMGKVVDFLDRVLNAGSFRFTKGIFAAILLILLGLLLGLLYRSLPDFGLAPIALIYDLIEIVLVSILLAHRSLISHVENVANGLTRSVQEGRQFVSYIVGRETSNMTESDVSRAAVESVAENFSDGVIAPALWYLFFGLPGLLVYKLINTADSMVGYQNEKYRLFGFGSAKADDILNFIPARFTGALMCAIYQSKDAFDTMVSDADLHRSLNAGWPEAAIASILGVALSGPRSYPDQSISQDSYLNPRGRMELNREDIRGAISVLQRTWLCFAAILAFLVILIWLL